jgi:DNA-nicking Smr family endonuclease
MRTGFPMGRKRKNPGKSALETPKHGMPFQVEEELDLHGLAIDEAMVQVELALARWRNRSGACIRIIHGGSSGSKVSIKGSLRRNLESKWKGKVGSFRPELGNPGSTLVFLPGQGLR